MLRITLRLGVLVAALLVSPAVALADAIKIDFESLAEFDPLTTQFPGLTFLNATVLTAGSSLNEIEFPPHSGQNVVFDDGGPMSIAFDSPVFGVGGYFTYLGPLTLTAFDASSNIIGSITSSYLTNLALSGDIGSSPNDFLTFSSLSGISLITIAGDPSGGSLVLDDLTFETAQTQPVPEPATLALMGSGFAALVAVRRRRQGAVTVDK